MPEAHGHSGHGHPHGTGAAISNRKMGFAVGLTLTFVLGEAIAGYFGNSLALLSDSGHNLADAAALGFSWYALWIAKKPAHEGMTFGYHRAGILAALVNAVSLVVIAVFIIIEAIERLHRPEEVSSGLMIAVAFIAIVVNVVISMWLHAGSKDDLNVRAAYIHMVGDAISAVGVVIAGIVVAVTHQSIADPIVSFVIALLILKSSWGVLKESVSVLMEATPKSIDMKSVVAAIRGVPGVLGAHDLHVWTVGPGAIACCVHILVGEQSVREGQQILQAVVKKLDHDFKINHSTIQVEVEGHDSNDLFCCIEPSESHVGHAH